jgi:hypothetical protein
MLDGLVDDELAIGRRSSGHVTVPSLLRASEDDKAPGSGIGPGG